MHLVAFCVRVLWSFVLSALKAPEDSGLKSCPECVFFNPLLQSPTKLLRYSYFKIRSLKLLNRQFSPLLPLIQYCSSVPRSCCASIQQDGLNKSILRLSQLVLPLIVTYGDTHLTMLMYHLEIITSYLYNFEDFWDVLLHYVKPASTLFIGLDFPFFVGYGKVVLF